MDYPENIYDSDAWLAVSPPPQLGPAIQGIVQTVVALTPEQRATLADRFGAAVDVDPDKWEEAEARLDEAYTMHPISHGGCVQVADVSPWLSAIYHRIGQGPALVVQAVACRDHSLLTDADFRLFTGWWTNAGQAIPDPINADQLAELTRWWREQ